MKVYLLQDVKSLGRKGEVVDVNDGFARNFLIKKNLGVQENSKLADETRKELKQKVRQKETEAKLQKKLLGKLKGFSLCLKKTAAESGSLYSAVREGEIAEGIRRELQIPANLSNIKLKEPIHSLGSFSVRFAEKGESVEFQVIVEKEQ